MHYALLVSCRHIEGVARCEKIYCKHDKSPLFDFIHVTREKIGTDCVVVDTGTRLP